MIGGLSRAERYRAILKRERKYDGIFFFAARDTGIYCRPSCVLSHSPSKNYAFFTTAEEAKHRNYQACKICYPDKLQGELSSAVLNGINDGSMNEKGVHGFAESLHISERHLRRLVHDRTGASPTTLNNTRRLEAAKALITQTNLPIIDVAFRSEFASLRQFNDVFKEVFKISPRQMRKKAQSTQPSITHKKPQDKKT